jgi:hypothetical protein
MLHRMHPSAALDLRLHPKQWVAFESAATEILYGGAAGGGKSHLMRVAAIVWCTGIAKLNVYLFRRVSDDLIKNHMEGRNGFRALLAGWVANGWCSIIEDQVRFWNGSRIYLCHCKDEAHIYKYQGAEIDVLMIDELTHFTETMYRFLRSRLREVGLDVPVQHAGRFPKILCGANPGNIGHLWVKNTFILGVTPLFARLMPANEGGMIRQFIPARLDDNPNLLQDDPGYETRLEGLGSKTLVAAMRWGDWDVIEGAFFDCWSNHKHVIDPFAVPRDWLRFRSGDWGSASPTSIGWWAVVQDDFDVDGRTLPRGALVRYREDYIAAGPNKGLKLTAEQVADRIIEREAKDPKLSYGVLDPSAFAEDGGPSISERLNAKLVKKQLAAFRKADNARVSTAGGSGKRGPMGGWDTLRARMIGDGTATDPEPRIFCFSTCLDSIRTIPTMQHDKDRPEDMQTDGDDHCCDDWRYAAMSRPWLRPWAEDFKFDLKKDAYRGPPTDMYSGNSGNLKLL